MHMLTNLSFLLILSQVIYQLKVGILLTMFLNVTCFEQRETLLQLVTLLKKQLLSQGVWLVDVYLGVTCFLCWSFFKSLHTLNCSIFFLDLFLLICKFQIPGQRALALHLLASVLDKALHNVCENQVCYYVKVANINNRLIDWAAIWAYALGPEPEIALSLR